MKTRGRFRRIVVRGRRRYAVCGLRFRPGRSPSALARTVFWLPGFTLLAVLLFSAYVVGRPTPQDTRWSAPSYNIARYTFDDFANAQR